MIYLELFISQAVFYVLHMDDTLTPVGLYREIVDIRMGLM